VRSHYDLSNDFYRLWLGPTMMYSSGMWAEPGTPAATLDDAEQRKIDVTARLVLDDGPRGRVLDVGCGWGGNLRRLAELHAVEEGVGLTLSPAQVTYSRERPVAGVDVRLESWTDHVSDAPYDAIVSYGAFEHFARDGTTGAERVEVYRRFFGSCWSWLRPGGRLALETIAHDDAPDTTAPLGRGPLGDFVLEIFPESIDPHLTELVLGFEPWFEVEALRSDATDFARTCRAWLLGLRAHEEEATALVGEATFRRWRRYLAASEAQFRMGTITNYRVLLHRRESARW
jgi:cyclopropane-fatty-acyl-phospholipid synthase